MKRTFVPSKPCGIKRWEYTRKKGLICVYSDGLKCKSSWTLKELLKADHNYGDGLPAIELKEANK